MLKFYSIKDGTMSMPGEGNGFREEESAVKHRVKVDVAVRKKGFFGTREAVRKKTITVSGKEYRRMKRERWNAPASSEAQRLAALYLRWEEELAEERGE